jgi:hypothetical protein
LRRQLERHLVTTDDPPEFMWEARKQVDRFWVYRFVGRNKDKLAVHKAGLIEKKRHEVSADDLERSFETIGVYLKDAPSLFVWNANETKMGSPKKRCPSQVIVVKGTPLGTTTMAAVRDDAPLTLLTAVALFGDSIPPLIITKNQIYEKHLLAEHQLYEEHDYVTRNAAKTFITEILLTEWLKMVFLPRIENLRAKVYCTSPVRRLLDGHSTHITGRMVVMAGSERILIIRSFPIRLLFFNLQIYAC